MKHIAKHIKKNGLPAYSQHGVWNGKVGHAAVPKFMLTEFTLTEFMNDTTITLGNMFDTIKTHFLRQADLGDIPAWTPERIEHIDKAQQHYKDAGLWESTAAEEKWKYIEKMVDDFGYKLDNTPVLPLIAAKRSQYLWNEKNHFVRVPEFFSSKQALDDFVSNPDTTVGDIYYAAKNYFDNQITEGNLPEWSPLQIELMNSVKKWHENEGIFTSSDLYTKWSVIPEIMFSFVFKLDHHPLINFSQKQEKILYDSLP